MIARIILQIFILITFVSPVIADQFQANRVCILHSEDNSTSPNRGRLEPGERAPILRLNEDESWVKISHNGVEGWVYSRRGSIIEETATTPTTSAEMHWYFGNIHAHTSEGSRESNISTSTHEDAFEYAMDNNRGNLDFLAVTPHNHLISNGTYDNLLATARSTQFYQAGTFVPIAGQEYSSISQGNHINVFELDAWIDPSIVENGDFDALFDQFIPTHFTEHTFAQFNHPNSSTMAAYQGREYGRDDYPSVQAWISATDRYVQAIEIISAPGHDDRINRPHFNESNRRVNAWLWALNEGWHLGPTANQDNHRPNWGTASDSRTVIIAPALTLGEVTQAFQQRHFYASEDSTMKVTFRAGNHWMGSIININDFNGFTVSVSDVEEPNALYVIEMFSDTINGDQLRTSNDPSVRIEGLHNDEERIIQISEPEGNSYHFIKVTQSFNVDDHNESEDNAWTSPIWLTGDIH